MLRIIELLIALVCLEGICSGADVVTQKINSTYPMSIGVFGKDRTFQKYGETPTVHGFNIHVPQAQRLGVELHRLPRNTDEQAIFRSFLAKHQAYGVVWVPYYAQKTSIFECLSANVELQFLSIREATPPSAVPHLKALTKLKILKQFEPDKASLDLILTHCPSVNTLILHDFEEKFLVNLKPFKQIKSLTLIADEISDQDWLVLGQLHWLEVLKIEDCAVTNVELKFLQPLKKLHTLACDRGDFSAQGFEVLKDLPLQSIKASRFLAMDENGIPVLETAVHLKGLSDRSKLTSTISLKDYAQIKKHVVALGDDAFEVRDAARGGLA